MKIKPNCGIYKIVIRFLCFKQRDFSAFLVLSLYSESDKKKIEEKSGIHSKDKISTFSDE